MATTIIFCSFQYTLLDSSRLSMDPDFVRGGEPGVLRFTDDFATTVLGTRHVVPRLIKHTLHVHGKPVMLSWLKETNIACNE